jgi:hypothetical protein
MGYAYLGCVSIVASINIIIVLSDSVKLVYLPAKKLFIKIKAIFRKPTKPL